MLSDKPNPNFVERYSPLGDTGSIETLGSPTDKYEISNFARDNFPLFLSLVNCLSPRDAEILLCFAILQKRPTDLSILFGKAGHRAEEDLHKAAHKLAGLIAFGPCPAIAELDEILRRHNLERFGVHSFAACIFQYARCRDFTEMSRLLGERGLRQHMLRAFKLLHAADGRDGGLLAGWILWLVDGSDPKAKGWRQRKRSGREHKLGPTVFRSDKVPYGQGGKLTTEFGIGRASGRGGRGQRPDTVKITRKLKFLLRGTNA